MADNVKMLHLMLKVSRMDPRNQKLIAEAADEIERLLRTNKEVAAVANDVREENKLLRDAIQGVRQALAFDDIRAALEHVNAALPAES